jgi:hypothetical protein
MDEEEEDEVYIYGLFDPETNECQYVGRTSNPDKRYAVHLSVAANPLTAWVVNLYQKGQAPTMKVLETCGQATAMDRENYWIDEMGGLDKLLNAVTAGKITKRGERKKPKATTDKCPTYTPIQVVGSPLKARQIRRVRRRIRDEIRPKHQYRKIRDHALDEPDADVQPRKQARLDLSLYPPDDRVKEPPRFGCHDPDCVDCHVRQNVCWKMRVYGGYRTSK